MNEPIPFVGNTDLTDDELIEKARRASNGMAFTLRFERPFESVALQSRYETRQQAETALLANLAWWSGHDPAQMWRVFQRSQLYRPRVESYPEYRRYLIETALELVGEDRYDSDGHSARGATGAETKTAHGARIDTAEAQGTNA